jgi:hypothetical protein
VSFCWAAVAAGAEGVFVCWAKVAEAKLIANPTRATARRVFTVSYGYTECQGSGILGSVKGRDQVHALDSAIVPPGEIKF